ncbi:hypothetical protein COSHB9_02990 [Companilactobacillus alimentarius]
MSKRQLGSRYKDLVDYINERKNNYEIMKLCKDIFEETNIWDQDIPGFSRTKEYKMIFPIYNDDFDWPDRDKLVPIIVDIYNDNYELEEPKYYWLFKELRGLGRCDLYFGIIFDDEPLLIDISDCGTAEKCTKSELNDYLHDTELTADNFTPVEEIEND